MPDNNVFTGRISSVVYEDAGFTITKIVLDGPLKTVATVKGRFPGQTLTAGTWVSFEGVWTNHPTYGRQISVIRSPVNPDVWTNEITGSILSANGVGPTHVSILTGHAKTLNVLLADLLDGGASSFGEIPNLEAGHVIHAVDRWRAARARLHGVTFLAEAGVAPHAIEKVWRTFGDDLENILQDNPWQLVQIEGIAFKEADEVAMRLGIPLESPKRLEGAVMAAVGSAPAEGHLFMTFAEVIDHVSLNVPNVTSPDIASAVKALVTAGTLKLDRDTKPGTVALYDPAIMKLEILCAEMLFGRMLTKPCRDLGIAYAASGPTADAAFENGGDLISVARAALEGWSTGVRTDLTADQMQAALNALTAPVSLLTGLPGTGKTTALKAVVSVLKDSGVRFLLVAPTGIAAKRLSSVVNAEAATIHRAFGATGISDDSSDREVAYEGFLGEGNRKTGSVISEHEWSHGPSNPHSAEVIIVDETSMVDLHMLSRLLLGSRNDTRLVFVGDPFQLPSVGAGNILGDLVQSRVFAHTHLTQIFRQENMNGIVLAAHAIHNGKTPDSDGKDFVVVPATTEEEASDLVARLAKGLYHRRINFQVLSPRHSGASGVTSLNERIRSDLNPSSPGMTETKLGGSVVREGDRVMVVKNDYDLGVYNGDVGTIRRIDRVSKDIEVAIFGAVGSAPSLRRFPFKEASKSLRLAYAQTIHKCVHPDTIVWANGCMSPFSDIPAHGMIAGPMGMKPYLNFVRNPNGPLIEFTTRYGYSLTVTPEHGIDVWDATIGRYVRKEARDVQISDLFRMSPNPSSVSTPISPFILPDVSRELKLAYPRVARFPKIIDHELAEFMGMVLSFGEIHTDGVRIRPWILFEDGDYVSGNPSSWDPADIIARFTDLSKSLFNLDPVPEVEADARFKVQSSVFIQSAYLAQWFKNMSLALDGLWREDYDERRVPTGVFQSDRAVRVAFLRGYFSLARVTYYDTVEGRRMSEGTRKARFEEDQAMAVSNIWVKPRTARIDRELRALLLDLGVIASRTTRSRAMMEENLGFDPMRTRLILRGEDISLFNLRVGFLHPDTARVAAWQLRPGMEPVVPISESEKMPLREILRKIRVHVGRVAVKVFTTNTIPRSYAREIVMKSPSSPLAGSLVDRMRFFHDPVVGIVHLTGPSACVSVPDGHQFIQGGFVGWNSQGQEYDEIVLPLLGTFGRQLQRNLLYTAITRARKRVFIVGQASAVAKAVGNDSAERRNTLLAERIVKLSVVGAPAVLPAVVSGTQNEMVLDGE